MSWFNRELKGLRGWFENLNKRLSEVEVLIQKKRLFGSWKYEDLESMPAFKESRSLIDTIENTVTGWMAEGKFSAECQKFYAVQRAVAVDKINGLQQRIKDRE